MPAFIATSGHQQYITFALTGVFIHKNLILITLPWCYEKWCVSAPFETEPIIILNFERFASACCNEFHRMLDLTQIRFSPLQDIAVNINIYLRQFGHRPRQQRPAELLLGADGCWEGRGWEHGGHRVDPCDPRLHLLRVPATDNTRPHMSTPCAHIDTHAQKTHKSNYKQILNSKTQRVGANTLISSSTWCPHQHMASLRHQRDNCQRMQPCCW